jgi:hypothetical protein
MPGGYCVNRGGNALVPASLTADIRGYPRIDGTSVDIGAYEYTANVPPTAVAVVTPLAGQAPLDVNLDGTGSSDFDGAVVAWSWTANGQTIGSAAVVDHTFPDTRSEPTSYTVTLTVTDDGGASSSTSVTVNVAPPTDTDGDGMPDYWEDDNASHGFDSGVWDDPAADGDGDTLSDLDEYLNDTNPGTWDTDGDLMPDTWEIANSLDPTVDDAGGDSDGDTLTNLEEYQAGTSPGSADTDGDSLPDQWELTYYDPANPTELDPLLRDSDGDGTDDDQEDTDGDGALNSREEAFGTDPTDPDSVPPPPATGGGGCASDPLHGRGAGTVLLVMLGCLIARSKHRGCEIRRPK